MELLDKFGMQALPDEKIVVAREGCPYQGSEILGVTSHRFIYLGEAWPGPSFFGCSVPIESCRLIEYRRRSNVRKVCLGAAMAIAGGYGFIFCVQKDWWLLYFPCILLFFWGVPLLFYMFRIQWIEICFYCGEDNTLIWSLTGKRSEKVRSIKEIREIAKNRGIATSNFPSI